MFDIDLDKFKRYFECDCGCHMISLSKDEDSDQVYMSYWELGHGGRRSIKRMWHHIKRIIQCGEPFADDIIFSPEEFIKFRDFVIELSAWKVREDKE